ncbi:MAG: hypothetical protein IJ206_10650 [Oscillospiraceae bacterium]|nr:hypothetical protein [Oscillospiraceae bacterium]
MMKVSVKIPVRQILDRLGLGRSYEAQVYLAKAVRDRCDKYVPYDTGALRSSATVSKDGGKITYTMPYASRQFYEKYHHRDPNRGDHWHRRMLRREKQSLLRQMERYWKGAHQ